MIGLPRSDEQEVPSQHDVAVANRWRSRSQTDQPDGSSNSPGLPETSDLQISSAVPGYDDPMNAVPDSGGPPERVFRNKGRQRTCLILGGLCLAVALVWLVTVFTLTGAATRLELMVVFLALAAYAYYASRACVVVSQNAVVVRNPLRRVAVPLDEVSRFDVDSHFQGAPGNLTSIVLLRRTDGSAIRCAGATSYSSLSGCTAMARQLNGALGRGSFPGTPAGRQKRALLELQDFAARLGKNPAELTEQERDRFLSERGAGG
jgi:hypothetical protein